MKAGAPTDYETYKEIMDELLRPIAHEGLDLDTLKRLYESKLVYLENLRTKCFYAMNSHVSKVPFSQADYQLILRSLKETKKHLHDLILLAVSYSLETRKIV